ncbi:hypothetical protein LTR47_011285 [Exophiala xenobiotica]|nr:hypothetical protein LTR72_011525 [Exophiala xenobiotica]KAK5220285.1 hypothetical protein LTR47_011285 [Exophiala xenobiotica]KAK5244342.1 hypothetical protein LTS06_010072 [Exophiala xenobiotica]KAK5260890.1 hypothetical protein LTR40_003287 [Exophiala xenobiotica]KAK5344861.1 hypothetical protein LTR61_011379 [Exophiala xenobiotica]
MCELQQDGDVLSFRLETGWQTKACLRSDRYPSEQQFILDTLLRSIKYNDADLVQRLVEAIRLGRPLLQVATTLQDNIRALQGKFLSKEHQVTQSDMISLALNSLSDSDFRPHGNCRPSFPQHQTLVRGHSIRVTKNTVILDGARTNATRGIGMDQMSQQFGGRSEASGPKEAYHRQRDRDRTNLSCDTLGMGGPGTRFIIAPCYMDMPPALAEHCPVPKSPPRKHEWSVADSCTMHYAPQQHQHQDQVYASTDQRFTSNKLPACGRQQPHGYFPNYFREHEIGQPATYINAQFNTTCIDNCDAASQMSHEVHSSRRGYLMAGVAVVSAGLATSSLVFSGNTILHPSVESQPSLDYMSTNASEKDGTLADARASLLPVVKYRHQPNVHISSGEGSMVPTEDRNFFVVNQCPKGQQSRPLCLGRTLVAFRHSPKI